MIQKKKQPHSNTKNYKPMIERTLNADKDDRSCGKLLDKLKELIVKRGR